MKLTLRSNELQSRHDHIVMPGSWAGCDINVILADGTGGTLKTIRQTGKNKWEMRWSETGETYEMAQMGEYTVQDCVSSANYRLKRVVHPGRRRPRRGR